MAELPQWMTMTNTLVGPLSTEPGNINIACLLFKLALSYSNIQHQHSHLMCLTICETCNKPSDKNLKTCKNSLLKHCVANKIAREALFKYLLYLAKMFTPKAAIFKIVKHIPELHEYQGLKMGPDGEMEQPPVSSMRRTHLLYIILDVIGTIVTWMSSGSIPDEFKPWFPENFDLEGTLQGFKAHVMLLMELAACRGENNDADDATPALLHLVDQMEGFKIFSKEEMAKLSDLAKSSKDREHAEVVAKQEAEMEKSRQEALAAEKEAEQWILPGRHGVKNNPDAPWHELPAANGLYMRETRGYPLKAGAFEKGGFPLKHGRQEAPDKLKKDVEDLHKEMLHCFDPHTKSEDVQDVDPLGNKVWKDPERPTRNYWGFTLEGIEKMQKNREELRKSNFGYGGVEPVQQPPQAAADVNAAVARARELAASRGFGDRGGRGRGGRGGRGGGFRGRRFH